MSCRSPGCGIVAAPSPSSRSSSRLAASPASLVDVLPALPSLIACVPSSSRSVVPSSHPSSRAILLACRHASRFTARPASRFSSRLSSRSPLVMSSPSCPIAPPCRSACGHRSPRPACRLAGSGTGRDCLSRHHLPALPPLLTPDGVSPACVSSLRSALLARVPPFMSVL